MGNIRLSLSLAAAGSFALAGYSSDASAGPVIEREASYYVRPVLRVGAEGELQDGLQQNGPTSATQTQGVVGYSESEVNLQNGTVKMYSESYDGFVNLQTFGGFGERLTFRGGAGTDWNLSFSVDGYLETYGGGTLLEGVTEPLWFYDVGIAVFRPGQADWSNFVTRATDETDDIDPILFEYDVVLEEVNYVDEYDSIYAELSVSGLVPLLTDFEQFDIFAFTNVIVDTESGDGLESFTVDFTDTASYSQVVNPDVEVFSSSGQFLNLQAPTFPPLATVPVPATGVLFGLGMMIGMGQRYGFRRRKVV